MIGDLSIDDISALLMVVFTCVITIANILLWLSTRRTIALQVKSNYSLNHQSLVTGHRDLFLGLLHQPDILEKFAIANSIDVDSWELKIVSAFFINQIFVHYLNLTNGTIEQSYLEGLKQDAREVFSFPTVQSHWKNSRVWYAPDFQRFVEEELLSPSTDQSSSVEVSASKI
ncbi:hypothetical protein D0962_33965 [Leptolyngbyaceae cyanobacterium CCMR0082]|uniref:Uncharacterized protein n=1 Tax=Adonisia turfae CCMR0082 TaxID=2304604 RepID=A0A6M0SIC4_9CYAN|nr:hypothetical protein [Adonisia turfae]NEZ67711.1 hypothetical protein [Adonisia turfae CCMR0082]